jgi:hypothetical protein
MNVSSVFINVNREKQPIKIEVFITDTNEMISQKIIHAINPEFPSFVFFTKKYNAKTLLEKNETFTFLNLFTLPCVFKLKPYDKTIDINFKLLDEILLEYDIKQEKLYECLLFRLYLSKNFIQHYIKQTTTKVKKRKILLPGGKKISRDVPKPTGDVPKPTGYVPKPTGYVPKPTGYVPKPTGYVPKPTGDVPKPTGYVPKPTGEEKGTIKISRGVSKEKKTESTVKSPTEVDVYFSSNSPTIDVFLKLYKSHQHIALLDIENFAPIKIVTTSLKKKLDIISNFNFNNFFIYNERLVSENIHDIKLSIKYQEEFNRILPLEATEIENTGKVVFLEIETQETSTGIIFNNLELNESIPVAQYKDFFKIFQDSEILEDVSKDELMSNDVCIYRYEKRRGKKSMELVAFPQIYIENTSFGIKVQVLLLNDSFVSSIDKLFEFLKLPSNIRIRSEYNRGLLGNFTIFNPKPSYYPNKYKYASLQTPIFNNLIMNDILFDKFLYVNDSDKIGRDTNTSAIYFHSSSSSTKEKEYAIKVGNWKKDSTRFGDLSALLVPITTVNNEYQIQCRILRSFNQDTVNDFQYILVRLLVLYNEKLTEQIDLFQNFIPYEPYEVQRPMLQEKDLLLTKVEPLIFKPNDYTRGCQNKPPVIVDNLKDLMPEKVLQFPKYSVEYKGHELKPRYYYCQDGIPGYIQMNVDDHPFDGKAPCCYGLTNFTEKKIQARLKKNQNIEKELFPSLHDTSEKDAVVETRDKPVKIKRFVMYTPTNEYKVLNRLGQFGNLPSSVIEFLENIDLNDSYYRVGICSEWKFSSILACGEYASILDQIYHDETKAETIKYMPIETQMRQKFSSICFNIVAQENCNEVDNVKDYVLNFQNKLNVRRLYNAIQYYFKVNLLVINTKGEWVRPNSCFSFCSHFFPQRPILLLYEHTQDLRYEIIAKKHKDKIMPYFETDDLWTFTYKQILQTFTKNQTLYCLTNIEQYSWIFKIEDLNIHSQILNKIGQVQVLMLRYLSSFTIPIYFEKPIAPFAVESIEHILQLPSEKNVLEFIKHIQCDVFENKRDEGVYRIYDFFFIPYDTKQNTKKPHFVYYFLNKDKIIDQWNTQVGNFIYTNLLKDYLLILFGQFIKNSELKDTSTFISLFIDTHIHWTDMYPNDWKQFHPLFNKNNAIYNGDNLLIPRELEDSIFYLLEWYYRNKYEQIINLTEERELPSFFIYTNQFKTIQHHSIQKTENHLQTHTYNNLYLFSIEELTDPNLLQTKTIYYHYDMLNIRQFFILPYSIENNFTIYSYIYTILYQYYKTGNIDFDLDDLIDQSSNHQTFDNTIIKEKDEFIFVFFPF